MQQHPYAAVASVAPRYGSGEVARRDTALHPSVRRRARLLDRAIGRGKQALRCFARCCRMQCNGDSRTCHDDLAIQYVYLERLLFRIQCHAYRVRCWSVPIS